MQRCAPEIWIEILRWIGEDERIPALKALTLLFKALTPYAQAELFRSVDIETVSRVERLLAVSIAKPTLLQSVSRVSLSLSDEEGETPVWEWLLRGPGANLLAFFTRVSHLELRKYTSGRFPEPATAQQFFSSFKAVTHVRFADSFSYADFTEIAILLSTLPPDVRYCEMGGLLPNDCVEYDHDPQHVPSVLSQETLANHMPPEALGSLKSFVIAGGSKPHLTEWLLRSGVADRIQALTLDPRLSYDLDLGQLLLTHGCRNLESLTLRMADGGWEDLDTCPIALPAHLHTIRFLEACTGVEEFIESILATSTEDNALEHIEIATYAGDFLIIASEIDDLLTQSRFAKIVCVQVGLEQLGDGMDLSHYATLMPNLHERGVLQLSQIESIWEGAGEFGD